LQTLHGNVSEVEEVRAAKASGGPGGSASVGPAEVTRLVKALGLGKVRTFTVFG
jgi:hypothetical protein